MTEENLKEQRQALVEDCNRAIGLIKSGMPEKGLNLLKNLAMRIRAFPLSEEIMWTDFHSLLDGLLFEEYCQSEIQGREIVRHPLKPASILYTCGTLLVEYGQTKEALEVLNDLIMLDPVCPMYLFELTDCHKRLGNWEKAMSISRFALLCASTEEEFARCCRDIAFCLGETGEAEAAIMLYLFSLTHEDSEHAKNEIIYLGNTYNISPESIMELSMSEVLQELEIPEGICETVIESQKLLETTLG